MYLLTGLWRVVLKLGGLALELTQIIQKKGLWAAYEKSHLSQYKQDHLIELFVSGSTARTTAVLWCKPQNRSFCLPSSARDHCV